MPQPPSQVLSPAHAFLLSLSHLILLLQQSSLLVLPRRPTVLLHHIRLLVRPPWRRRPTAMLVAGHDVRALEVGLEKSLRHADRQHAERSRHHEPNEQLREAAAVLHCVPPAVCLRGVRLLHLRLCRPVLAVLDEKGLPTAWKMWVSIIPMGGVTTSWENWVDLGNGALVSSVHQSKLMKITLSDIRAGSSIATLYQNDPFRELIATLGL